ncbi:xanthine dehydrogenase accessory protein XdhC [Flocculibacter collagenilyticus]|uniref:xanthine dehydrogenase accessory protein XdhC n=1 Tax=Flocculibacter collagenilyticus TaxID=2744479 RepID=UPI0018F43A44|nr:xanthine dehydrogenase accessory protein XdhC [Flocculibacter collagenilyticus]
MTSSFDPRQPPPSHNSMPKMHEQDWLSAANYLSKKQIPYVIATVIVVKGSAPRDAGSKMVITQENSYASIGGGHLEFQAIQTALQLIADNHHEPLSHSYTDKHCAPHQHIEHYQLAAKLGQCCGGQVTILFEYFSVNRPKLVIFGAGHVTKALLNIMQALPIHITLVDSREALLDDTFIETNTSPQSSDNIVTCLSDQPEREICTFAANTYYLVLTHNHQLDFEICHNILKRDDAAYIGLIGSNTKWRRFVQRFRHRDIQQSRIDTIRCPVGNSNVPGKRPMEVAVSIAAELIALFYQDNLHDYAPRCTPHLAIDGSSLQKLFNANEDQHMQDNKHLADDYKTKGYKTKDYKKSSENKLKTTPAISKQE